MALWYDSKRHEYASDGKSGWFIKYCDTLVKDLRELFEAHFKGLSNRHNARDVDYDEEKTVRDKLDEMDSGMEDEIQKLEKSVRDETQSRENGDNALGGRIDGEARTREETDTALGSRIDGEIQARQEADTALEGKIAKLSEAEGKADRGAVDGAGVDSLIGGGIYHIAGEYTAEYTKPDTETANMQIYTILVSNSGEGSVRQIAFGDDDSAFDGILVRYGDKNDGGCVWQKWKRIDDDLRRDLNGLNLKCEKSGGVMTLKWNSRDIAKYSEEGKDGEPEAYLCDIGSLGNLETADKTGIVAAINELKREIDGLKQ